MSCAGELGSTEQHGHHLPLDVDNFLARSVCVAAAKRIPRETLVMPIPTAYGYNEHALDFPGTIHVTYAHFIEYCLDVCESVAHAGFESKILVRADHHHRWARLERAPVRRMRIARRATLDLDDVDQPGRGSLRGCAGVGLRRRVRGQWLPVYWRRFDQGLAAHETGPVD